MIKIPPSLGDQNINLTMEYLQEEEDPTLDKVEEEEGNSSFTSFRFIFIKPLIIRTIGSF